MRGTNVVQVYIENSQDEASTTTTQEAEMPSATASMPPQEGSEDQVVGAKEATASMPKTIIKSTYKKNWQKKTSNIWKL